MKCKMLRTVVAFFLLLRSTFAFESRLIRRSMSKLAFLQLRVPISSRTLRFPEDNFEFHLPAGTSMSAASSSNDSYHMKNAGFNEHQLRNSTVENPDEVPKMTSKETPLKSKKKSIDKMIQDVEAEIRTVEEKIAAVELKIDSVSEKLEHTLDPTMRSYLIEDKHRLQEKEKQLRVEKNQLRDKEKQLREEKKQLREKENKFRGSSLKAGSSLFNYFCCHLS